jgi:DNA-binding NtrC family response regulator
MENKNKEAPMAIIGESAGMAITQTCAIPEVPRGAQILIVADDQNAEQLVATLREAGIGSKTARSMTEACEFVKSGDFQAVLSKPMLSDGSWRRLVDVAVHYDLGFEVVLVAQGFHLDVWSEALNEGAFDVLDTHLSQSGTTVVAKRALWAGYLKGAGPNPRATSPRKAA